MESKKHFKLYKSGKQWCAMAIATAMATIGVATTTQSVHADVNVDSTNSVQQVNNNSNNNEQTTYNTETDNNQNNANPNSSVLNDNVDTSTNTEYVSNQSATKNGWYDENGQKVYYTNGQTENGRHYEKLASIDGTNTQNYYLVDNGVVQSGLQEWMGSHYYFDPNTYLVQKNTYVDPNHNNTGYLLGSDGIAKTGVQKWMGTYYDFDANTYQLIKNSYAKSQWGDYYMFGSDGRIVTGAYDWMGSKYYFDESSYLRVDNDYRVPAGSDRGYLLGSDGRALTGVQKWQGTYYYFDPSNYQLVKNSYVQSQWGDWYMFGNDGRIITGLYKWQGTLYYFDPSSYLVDKNMDVTVNGVTYHLDNSGAAMVVNNAAAKADKALTMLGTPYVWGGNKPGGFDCSGLVQWAFGLGSNYRTTYQQTNLGTHQRNVYSAPKGALVFFGSDSAPYHVGISLGNGTFVHAPEPGDKVKVTKMAYYTPSFYIVMK